MDFLFIALCFLYTTKMTFIALESSTDVCSAALFIGEKCISSLVEQGGANHAKQLPLFVEQLISLASEKGATLDFICLSQGPGSYTGLRIGTALAKGLCYGMNIPLVAIDTLQLLACSVPAQQYDLICPMIDARRMEVYTALYSPDLQRIEDIQALVVNNESFKQELTDKRVCFCGNGAEKCKKVISSNNAVFLDNIIPLAENMGRLAIEKYNERDFADIAYFDPLYLKEFQATVAKNKIF